MAHFAQLNEENIVIQVIVVSNEDIKDENGNESEDIGINFCKNVFGENTNWIQTSYNGHFRKRYAELGMIYDSNYDAFYFPNPYPGEWIFDETELQFKQVVN
jgi:hypothetical protein